jgi:hypothetical protein
VGQAQSETGCIGIRGQAQSAIVVVQLASDRHPN